MKKIALLSITASVCFLSSVCLAQTFNVHYLDAEIKKAFETRDVAKTEWGTEAFGIRLGILLSKNDYETGESIFAKITLTNASTTGQWHVHKREDGIRTDIELILLTSNGSLVPSANPVNNNLPGYTNGRVMELPPGASEKRTVELNKLFNIQSSGVYYVYAKKHMPDNHEGKPYIVMSGNAQFIIRDKLGAAGNVATAPVGVPAVNITKAAGTSQANSNAIGSTRVITRPAPAVSLPNGVSPVASSESTMQSVTPLARPLFAQFGESTRRKLSAFGILLLSSLIVLAFIFLRARSRAAGTPSQPSRHR